MPSPLAYVGAFGGSLALAWLLTPLMLRLAVRRNWLDAPSGHKAHSSPVPLLGGVAIVLAFSIALAVSTVIYHPGGDIAGNLAIVVGVGCALAFMGLVDDLRGLPVWLRLITEIGAGVAMWAVGSGTTFPGPAVLNVVVTVVWVVGITNAFNMLDNMDGLSAGVATIAALSFTTIAGINGQYLVAALSVAVAGCAAGFLRHNFHPAKIYMGDAGSLFLGYLLAFIGIRLRLSHTPLAVATFVPIFVLGVPLFDTTLVTISRLAYGRSPLKGGRDHTSHRLVAIGLPVRAAVWLVYAAGVLLGWLAIILSRVDTLTGMLLVGFLFALALALLVLLFEVPVYENSRRRRTMLRLVAQPSRPDTDLHPVGRTDT